VLLGILPARPLDKIT